MSLNVKCKIVKGRGFVPIDKPSIPRPLAPKGQDGNKSLNSNTIKNYAELIISMSTDFLMGKITEDLYTSNLQLMLKSIIKDKK